MGQLSERMHALWPDAPQQAFSQSRLEAADCRADVLRRETMWFPRYSIVDDLPAQKQAWEAGRGNAPRRESWRARLMRRRRLVQTLELLLGRAAAELLTWATGAQVQFRMIDFQLLFIVLMGTMYGMQWGIAAAGLESIFLAHAYSAQNVNWLTLFYEPTNWVAFIAYFTVGAVCGYVRGKGRDDFQFARQEGENVRKGFAFLRQLYQDAVRGNQELRRQIISSQDSFGKIFHVTQQLDVTEPREVFSKAVKVLGELLENESIAIYSVGKNKGFVRLEASSRAIMRSVPQALRMQSLESALAALEKGDVGVNTQFLPDMPAYLACARENGETVLLIEIVQAKYTQVIKPYAFSMPDIQYIGVTEETYDALAQAVPGLIEQYHQDYRESLEKPMPFYIGVPQTDGGRMNLIWDAAYDFDAEDITYLSRWRGIICIRTCSLRRKPACRRRSAICLSRGSTS